tara:strand:- start:1111 stop:1779 length:669 start_codon:yes stop_codon:yes gene_type:complete
MAEGKSRIAPGGLEKTEDGFMFTLKDNTRVPVNVFDMVDGVKVQQDDDVIAQAFATALGLSIKDVRQKFKDQNVDLGDFKPELFTTFKSEASTKPPRYERGIVRGDPDSLRPKDFLEDKLGTAFDGGYFKSAKTDGEVSSAFNSLASAYWDADLGGEIYVENGNMIVTFNGEMVEDNVIILQGSSDPRAIWDRLIRLEEKARKKLDAKKAGGGTEAPDTSKY